jgi:hypothetical protein
MVNSVQKWSHLTDESSKTKYLAKASTDFDSNQAATLGILVASCGPAWTGRATDLDVGPLEYRCRGRDCRILIALFSPRDLPGMAHQIPRSPAVSYCFYHSTSDHHRDLVCELSHVTVKVIVRLRR